MKTQTTILTALFSLSTAGLLPAETAAQALEKGVQLQETEGQYHHAIAAYQTVISKGKKTTDAVAEARFRLAECYKALAEDDKAAAQLETLKADFGPTNPWVKKAAALSGASIQFLPAPYKPEGEFHYYQIQDGAGKVLGSFMSAIMANSYKGQRVWQSFFGRGVGEQSFSTCLFNADTFRPIDAQNYFFGLGNQIINFNEKGDSWAHNLSTGKEGGKLDLPDGYDCLYDNDQVIPLLRVIDLKPGEKTTMAIRNPVMPIMIPLELRAVEEVEITVPMGTFNCLKIESSILQTFYISTDESRHLVQLDMPGGSMKLSEVEDWVASEPAKLAAETLPIRFTLPESAMWYTPRDTEDRYKLNFHLADFSILKGTLEVRKKSSVEAIPTSSREYEDQILAKYKAKIPNMAVDEATREQVEYGDHTAEVAASTFSRGQGKYGNYHAHLVTDDYLVRVRCEFQPGEEKEAHSKLLQILQSLELD